MQSLYKSLGSEFPTFRYKAYAYEQNDENFEMTFRFEIENTNAAIAYVFSPKISIPSRAFYHPKKLTKEQLDILVFHIGMIELISYWKVTSSPILEIIPHQLNQAQIAWWKKLYFHGLGEFFHLNGIETTQTDFMEIRTYGNKLRTLNFNLHDEIIVPIGGGKDSVVTLGILNNNSAQKVLPFIINPRGATLDCVNAAGYTRQEIAEMKRPIDPLLLQLNSEGFLNGHTPFSAMLAFNSLLIAALTNKKHIALSNEGSANEATIIGTEVNHQYSKSYAFEVDFRMYVNEYISPDFNYFSFLRPLHEITIAKLFARQTKYFSVFKSCNVGSKEDIWCGHCPKCLFAFIILAPFIEAETMQNIFTKNLLNEPSLQKDFDELIGLVNTKPFECIGTVEEVNWALQQLQKNTKYDSAFLLQHYGATDISKRKIRENLVNDFHAEHFLTPPFEKILQQAIHTH